MEARSKPKLILKVLLVFAAVVVISAVGFIAFMLYHLPSANVLSSAILNPGQRQNLALVNDTVQTTQNIPEAPSVLNPNAKPSSATTQVTQSQTLNSRAGLEDLTNPNRPLSNFCSSLKNAKVGAMTEQETNKAFQLSLDEATADPRAQALKPLFRYILRIPQMQDLISEVNAAANAGQTEESFTQKAAFYAKVVAAFAALNTHKSDFEAIADRSYLYFNLNKAVALKPEIAADERLKKFCDDTENAFNSNLPVEFDQEKNNFERLLTELNVDQQSIGYNPDYKTVFEIKRDEKSMRLDGGWIEEAFAK
ncbi:MAG: hypothetical protein V4654_02015 [Bdellovibrionota bacterium]